MAEPVYATKEVVDTQIRHIQEGMAFERKMTDVRIESMEKILDERLGKMQAVIEKNLAEYRIIAGDIQGEMRESNAQLKGEIKAINARLDTLENKFAWNIAWVGIIMGLVLTIAQRLWQ